MNVNSICIVGGGTAGWMAATTFSRVFPDKKITLVESPSIATIGVGESTTQFFRKWLNFIDLDDSWMEECDATYKFSVRFENFNEEDPFHYPFTTQDSRKDPTAWFIHKAITPGLSVSDYADWYAPQMKAVNDGRIPTQNFDRFVLKRDTGFHFDATKFAIWLKNNLCQNVENIKADVTNADLDESGNIESLHLDNGVLLKADLFVDCTGFRSYLINDIMKTPWETFDDMLPNDSAWTVRLPYTDKKSQMRTYTNCTALKNGWVWNVPLRNRIGTGYNYSSKFISDEDALEEFKEHLGFPEETLCEYRNIKFKTGVSKKPWNKNVLAIGLSGGFIEPLESNGLLSVHEWLIYACQIIGDNAVRALDINAFNLTVTQEFKTFAYFVYYHYALSTRTDSPYWKYMTEQYDGHGDLHEEYLYKIRKATTPLNKLEYEKFTYSNYRGESFIMAGHGYNPFNLVTLRLLETENIIDKGSYISLDNYKHYDGLVNTFPFAHEYYES